MAALILPHRYRAQARGLVEVDYSHPLAAGLVSAYNMTSAPLRTSADSTGRYDGRKSSAGKNPYTLHGYTNAGTTEAGHVYCAEGSVWDFGGTYATKAYNTRHPKSWAGAVTFVIRVLLRSNTADQCLIGHFNDLLTPDYLYGAGLYVTGGTLYAVGASNNSRVLSTTAPNAGNNVNYFVCIFYAYSITTACPRASSASRTRASSAACAVTGRPSMSGRAACSAASSR